MKEPGYFRLWATGCAHVGTDLRVSQRESLAEAIRQSEHGGDEGGPPFDWDIALHLGDLSGSQTPPLPVRVVEPPARNGPAGDPTAK